ncbi:hypothetical protein GUJ93_ZPchr0006g45525 [Zizania palustris]|uniref:Uncharacterized protein n=1 Tax=Zizania palustris TaxID=103762 RepID=A0A8J5SXT9_ZIZPA|nr:hypothetical protein GUJ93_ZPchr0006g45525 [Zizania palustris]
MCEKAQSYTFSNDSSSHSSKRAHSSKRLILAILIASEHPHPEGAHDANILRIIALLMAFSYAEQVYVFPQHLYLEIAVAPREEDEAIRISNWLPTQLSQTTRKPFSAS